MGEKELTRKEVIDSLNEKLDQHDFTRFYKECDDIRCELEQYTRDELKCLKNHLKRKMDLVVVK